MEDLLAALLYGIFEIFGEVIVEVLFEAVASLLVRVIRSVFGGADAESPIFASVAYLLFGLIAGVGSLFLFPPHLVRQNSTALAC